MSELMQSLIREINDEHAARLTALEDALGCIEEAEELAATLRRHGAAGARAVGFVLGDGSHWSPAKTRVYVNATYPHDRLTAEHLSQTLRAADLRVSHIDTKASKGQAYLHLVGIDCPILADAEVCLGAAIHVCEEPAHG